MYRRPKFLEVLHEIREKMSQEANYDMGVFADLVRNAEVKKPKQKAENSEEQQQLTTDKGQLTTVYGNRI